MRSTVVYSDTECFIASPGIDRSIWKQTQSVRAYAQQQAPRKSLGPS